MSAIIGAAVIGSAAGLYGASKQASAAKKATQAQTQANDQAIQFQREQRGISQQALQPYVDRGNQAFSLMAPHLGMSAAPQQSTPTLGAGYAATGLSSNFAGGGGFNPQTYLQANPDVAQYYNANARQLSSRFPNAEAFANYHMQTFGESEQRPGMNVAQAMQPTGPQTPSTGLEEYQTPEQAQEAAWEKYRTETTYGKIGDYEAQKARGEYMDLAGSGGTALSGRTMRGMAEVGEEAAMRNFSGYMGMLGGISDQGYGATTGIASAGQTFANNASQLTQASGQARAAGALAQGQAWQTGLADAAGWGGWAMGQMGQRPASAGTAGTVHSGSNLYSGGSNASPSDTRVKTDIEPAGTREGHNWYTYRYVWDEPGTVREGVMAQEVLETRPDAVVTHPLGFLMVDYAALGLECMT